MRAEAITRLRQLSVRESHYDAKWVRTLDQFDEPPLFTRAGDVQFLAEISMPERGRLTMVWALEVLDAHARFLSAPQTGKEYFLSLTFMDWDLVASGDHPIPTPCLFVSPRETDELSEDFVLVSAVGPFGRAIESWMEPLNRGDVVVAESAVEDEFGRTYVGYRTPQGFESVGMRIPRDPGQRFHGIPVTHSTRSRSLIP